MELELELGLGFRADQVGLQWARRVGYEQHLVRVKVRIGWR